MLLEAKPMALHSIGGVSPLDADSWLMSAGCTAPGNAWYSVGVPCTWACQAPVTPTPRAPRPRLCGKLYERSRPTRRLHHFPTSKLSSTFLEVISGHAREPWLTSLPLLSPSDQDHPVKRHIRLGPNTRVMPGGNLAQPRQMPACDLRHL